MSEASHPPIPRHALVAALVCVAASYVYFLIFAEFALMMKELKAVARAVGAEPLADPVPLVQVGDGFVVRRPITRLLVGDDESVACGDGVAQGLIVSSLAKRAESCAQIILGLRPICGCASAWSERKSAFRVDTNGFVQMFGLVEQFASLLKRCRPIEFVLPTLMTRALGRKRSRLLIAMRGIEIVGGDISQTR